MENVKSLSGEALEFQRKQVANLHLTAERERENLSLFFSLQGIWMCWLEED